VPDTLADLWSLLTERAAGPLALRLVLQPTIATILAVRAAFEDVREGRPPFLWAVLTHRGHRLEALRQGWGDAGKVFLLAVALDLAYQVVVYGGVRPLELVAAATLLAFVPYVFVRGPLTRVLRLLRTQEPA
jgi:hypothetical protein